MRWVLLILSIGALAFGGLGLLSWAMGWLIGGNSGGDWLAFGGLLGLGAAVLGTGVARPAKHPGWRGMLIVLWVAGILSECAAGTIPFMWSVGNVDVFPKPPLPPDQQAASDRFAIAPVIVLSVAALLFTLLNWSKLRAPAPPPASATTPMPDGDSHPNAG